MQNEVIVVEGSGQVVGRESIGGWFYGKIGHHVGDGKEILF